MRTYTALAALLVCLTGCASRLPNAPDVVTPAAQTAPASIRLTLATRSDRQLDVTATVLTADGHFVKDVALTFAMDAGTVTPESAVTNGNGVAQAVASSTSSATLTVSAGALVASTRVDGVPSSLALYAIATTAGDDTPFTVSGFVSGTTPLATTSWTFGDGGTATSTNRSTSHRYTRAGGYTATVTATDTLGRSGTTSALITVAAAAAPPPPTPPTPPAPTPTLSATLTCTPVAHGSESSCNIAVSYRDALPSGAVTKVDWDWGDGSTSTTVPPSAPVGTRTYLKAGTYTVFATATANTSDGAKTATTSKSIVIP